MTNNLSFWLKITPFILSAILVFIILMFFPLLPPRLPLFYSLVWGEGQLAVHQQFLIIPAGIILIAMLNFTISSQLHPVQNFFKKILDISSFICSVILTIAFAKIVLMFL